MRHAVAVKNTDYESSARSLNGQNQTRRAASMTAMAIFLGPITVHYAIYRNHGVGRNMPSLRTNELSTQCRGRVHEHAPADSDR